MPRVYLSLGSNCRREASLAAALRLLRESFGTVACSPVYESDAEGAPGAPYLNLAASLETPLPLPALRQVLRDMEQTLGRERGRPEVVIDIDILLYGDLCGDFDGLTLPRPELLQRAYVLKPLADLAGQAVHPLTGCSFGEHWRRYAGVSALRAVTGPESPHA